MTDANNRCMGFSVFATAACLICWRTAVADDIVTRLRMQDADYALQEEAADEIERLRAEIDLKGSRLDDAIDEIERLRAEVARLGSFLHPIGEKARRG